MQTENIQTSTWSNSKQCFFGAGIAMGVILAKGGHGNTEKEMLQRYHESKGNWIYLITKGHFAEKEARMAHFIIN